MQATITRQEQKANEVQRDVNFMREEIERLQSYLSEDMAPSERSQVLEDIWETKMALVHWSNQLDEALDELFS